MTGRDADERFTRRWGGWLLAVLLLILGVLLAATLVRAGETGANGDTVTEASPTATPKAQTPGGSGSTGGPGTGARQQAGNGGGGGGGGPQPYTISGNLGLALHPGGTAQPFNVSFSTPNAGNGGSGVAGTRVSSLVVAISSITEGSDEPNPCTRADFALTQFRGAYPFYLPNGTSSLSSLGFGAATWPTLRLIDRPLNQDGCKGATIHLSYVGAP